MTQEEKPSLLTISEVATMLRVSDDTIRKMINEKTLAAAKIRGQWRIKRESVEKLLEESS